MCATEWYAIFYLLGDWMKLQTSIQKRGHFHSKIEKSHYYKKPMKKPGTFTSLRIYNYQKRTI